MNGSALRGFAAPLVLMLLAACASAGQNAQDGPVVGDRQEASLVVENQSTSDMRIYAIVSGQRVRLGSVTGLQTQTLEIPSQLVGGGRELAFEADPLAGQQSATSFSIYVTPGQQVVMRIPSRVR